MRPRRARSRARLSSRPPVLCLVVDRHCDRHPLAQAVRAAVAAGVDWVQLRERELEGADWLAWARTLQDAAAGARVIVNRRLDVALVIGADGVHLGFDAMSPVDAANLLPPGAGIGVSCHAPDEVRAARDGGATHAHLAPVWPPLSKRAERPALGVEAVRAASAHGLPVLAQGGVQAARCRELLDAGAAGIAVTGDILLARDPGQAAAKLRAALDARDD